MSLKQHFRIMTAWLASSWLLAFATSSQAAEMALADQPLFLGTQIDPNVFFMMDDSGSMDWEILTKEYFYYTDYWAPDSTPVGAQTAGSFVGFSSSGECSGRETYLYIYDSDAASNADNVYDSCSYPTLEDHPEAYTRDWRAYSSDVNVMMYNPSITYSPWIGFNDANFNAARSNPQSGTTGYSLTRDLDGFVYEVWEDDHGANLNGSSEIDSGPNDVTDTPNDIVDLWDSHTQYTVNNSDVDVVQHDVPDAATIIGLGTNCDLTAAQASPPYGTCYGTTTSSSTISGAGTDPWGRTAAQIRTNVANWYEFHRRRSFVSKGAVDLVVNANPNFRFGYSQINEYSTVWVDVPDAVLDDYDAHNAALLQEMYDFEWQSNGTPLRRGLERVGRYYDDDLTGFDDPIISACQQNYSILFTDGEWNGSAPSLSAIGDEDGDGQSDTLADVAKYFYDKDLSPLDDDVPSTPIDPNNAQHMVSFTVAFGLSGNLVDTDDDGYPNPELEEDGAWSSGSVNTRAEKIDDLWHAAFNSKAYYVAAQSPEEVASAIAEALLEIADRVGSAASVATNTGSLNAGSKLFQARFDSSDWSGQLLAFNINLDGTIDPTEVWEAGDELDTQNYDTGREIITWNPDVDNPPGGAVEGAGIPFRWPADYTSPNILTELSSDQIDYILTNGPWDPATVDPTEIADNQLYGQVLLNWYRGDDTNELSGQNFRLRNGVLGDIVNSDPRFVDVPNFRYPDALESASYNAFISAHSARQGVVYVGANDGMVHGFNDDTGAEMLAYMPNAVYQNLPELADVDYEHRYFVDAGPNVIDVFYNSAWHTVLAGGLAGGGQAVYALDVTDPSTFDESNADSIILWEFDDSDDADLGYTFGKVQMAKMNDGTWAAVFGNGYNNTEADGTASTTGHAVLYIVDVETGDIIKKIDTEAGASGTPNGLATPLLIDEDGDFTADYIYAGDLLGNLWKFDVSDSNTANWDVAWDSGSPEPLFTTKANQPITTQPQATFHPDNLQGFMIYFGTGQYLEETDNIATGQTTQAFYGIWDKNTTAIPDIDPDTDLLLQYITNQYDQSFDTDGDSIPDETFTLRDVSDNEISWTNHLGFRLDLYPTFIDSSANTDNFGERQVSNAIVRNGRIIFTTLVPSEVECAFGGTSFVMELDFRDGSALEFPAFDLNGDGEYDADDTLASGRASDVGIMPTVSILADGAQDTAFGSGASGDIDVIEISVGDQSYGRQSWRQLE